MVRRRGRRGLYSSPRCVEKAEIQLGAIFKPRDYKCMHEGDLVSFFLVEASCKSRENFSFAAIAYVLSSSVTRSLDLLASCATILSCNLLIKFRSRRIYPLDRMGRGFSILGNIKGEEQRVEKFRLKKFKLANLRSTYSATTVIWNGNSF